MVSGKYSALAGAIAREQSIANISNNLANVNTSGYRRSTVSFESFLRGARQISTTKGINYSRVSRNVSDFEQGAMRQTDNPYNFAIDGPGFFKIAGPQGPLYTRRGDFAVDQEGVLRTSSGMAVLDDANSPITIPDTDRDRLIIENDGTIATVSPEGTSSEVGTLGIVEVSDRTLLKRADNTSFSLEPGGVETPLENPSISQGFLELSNVNMTDEMTRMITSMRTFETYHKVLESYSTINQQQDELGTLG
ncbi:MAG: flagellar basal-body rod protein FlgF [Desulfopila sp.]